MATPVNAEEITGEIQSTLSLEASNKTRIKSAMEWINKRRAGLRPWTEFFNSRKLSKPSDAGQVSKRITKNLELYQTNYMVVCLLLVVYCIITSPLLLFALSASSGACYYISTRGQGQKIRLFGREFTVIEQYLLVLLISLPLFFLASAGSTVFWIIGASIFVICLHASVMSVSEADPEIQMEEIKSLP